jgi:hypothetical protein
MFHALHCLDAFRHALTDRRPDSFTPHHFDHCLNYLRQLVLCSADATLEPLDFREAANGSFNSPYFDRQCLDWSAVYSAMELYETEWLAYVKTLDW